jgi:hypothetical protein
VFGFRSTKVPNNVDWAAVRGVPDFYLNIPPMPDLRELWDYVAPHKPIVLTSIPSSVEEARANKHDWVRKHLGDKQPVICCRSSEKCLHARPGDILIDDWEKHRQLWINKGGRWVTHTSASDTISQLRGLGVEV